MTTPSSALTKRNVGFPMADLKLAYSQALLQTLTQYEHELNYSGSACAHDCPACRWIQRTSDAPWSDAIWSSDADDTRYVATALRLYWEHVGTIEGSFADLDAETQSTILQVAQRLKTSRG